MKKADQIKLGGLGSNTFQPGNVLNTKTPIKAEFINLTSILADSKNRPQTKIDSALLLKHGHAYPFDESDPYVESKREFLKGLIELSNSIKNESVQEPIRVYIHGVKNRIIFGERRFLASILAGCTDIPAIIDKTRPSNLRTLQGIENLQRQGTTAYERLLWLQDLIEEQQLNVDKGIEGAIAIKNATDLSKVVSLGERQCQICMSLLKGPSDVLEAMQKGKITSIKKAERLIKITDPKKRLDAIAKVEAGATLEEVADISSNEQIQQSTSNVSNIKKPAVKKKSPGAQKRFINLGKTEKVDRVKAILIKMCNKADLKDVEWSDNASVQSAWINYLESE